ncbi:MAG: DNA-binding protein [Clostridia bacterium]|nr:DNA-binding protein [Clostridia bacterium]MBR3576080.1 DNA-binding protein [Clostridia bacterium]
MSKDLNFSILLDFYGSILSERQFEIMDYYYNDDLSLAEIASEVGISRQGVRDALKKAENIITEIEEKLELADKFYQINDQINDIKKNLESILPLEDVKKSETIKKVIEDLSDIRV